MKQLHSKECINICLRNAVFPWLQLLTKAGCRSEGVVAKSLWEPGPVASLNKERQCVSYHLGNRYG